VTVFHGGNDTVTIYGDTWEYMAWGGACTTSGDCDDGFPCVTGFCCSSPCTGQCQVCSSALGSGEDGTCSEAQRGFPGNPPCAGGYVCSGSGGVCLTGCTNDSDCQTGFFCGGSSTCVARDSGAPDGSVPDGGLPDGSVPDGSVPDGGVPDGGLPDGPQPDAAGPDAPVGDGAASDAVGPPVDGPGPQQDAGGTTGTTSFLGCSAAPPGSTAGLPLLFIAVAAARLRRRRCR
jgi:uncharacterized protein (TIGR03382 family)